MRKNWTKEELDALIYYSSYCPPSILSKKIKRAESSVRTKLRELEIEYASKEEWYKKRIENKENTAFSKTFSKSKKHHETDTCPDILKDFWTKLIKYSLIAKHKNKSPNISEFINVYRQVNDR